MYLKLALVSLFAATTAGCGNLFDELTKDEVPHFKAVDGKVAIEALGSTVGTVVGELDTVLSQTGSGLSGPGTVQPPKELFEDDAGVATAPGFGAAGHEAKHLSDWGGPEVGPDGLEGWYYREITDTVWDYAASKQVVARWRYWLRFEPAYDIKTNGVKGAKSTHTNYGWSSEAGPWSGWRYVVRFGVTALSKNIDGSVRPATVEGSWLWEILPSATRFRGSRSEGKYVYALGDGEHLFGHDRQESDDETEQDPYFGLAVGGSRDIALTGKGKWSYTGQHADEDNKLIGKWYGGGDRMTTGAGVVKRTGETTLTVDIDFKYESGGYWAQGEKAAEVDYSAPPAFAKGVTPAGETWGIPEWYGYTGSKLTPRDGILYWYDGDGEFIINAAWDAVKVKAAQDKIDAARAILNDEDASAEEHTAAQADQNEGYEELEAAYSRRDSQFRSNNHWLTWNGQEDKRDWVSCSSPDLAPDCPDEEAQ